MDTRYERYNELTFEAYCKASIRHAVSKARQEKHRRTAHEVQLSALPEEALSELSIRDPCENSVLHLMVREALRYLPPKYRYVLLMYYYLGMTDREIARAMHISDSTANHRRALGLQRLRSYLEEQA